MKLFSVDFKIKILAITVVITVTGTIGYVTTPKKEFRLNHPEISQDKTYLVTNVVDGDTIEVIIEKSRWKVRMMGIDTPETVDPKRAPECFGKEASKATKDMLLGKKVGISLDTKQEKVDKFNRLLAYIYVDDIHLNKYLIENGYAEEYTYDGVYDFQKEFRVAEKQAKKDKKGMWLSCFEK